MANFCYIVHATQGDNVGTIDATDKHDALDKLNEIFCPEVRGKAHALVSVELITPDEFITNKARIEAERKAEAEFTAEQYVK